MATDLKLNGGIEAGGAITAGGNIVGNVVSAVGNVQGVDGVFSGVVSAEGNVQGVNGVFSGTVSGATGTFSAGVGNSYFKITPEGGFAVRLTNKSGAKTVKGQIVSHKGTVARAFDLTAVDAYHCLGVVYESGVADGAECWVVVAGIAQVLMKNAATMGHICRIPLAADNGAAGYAMDAAQSDTASVYKIGDVLETADAEVLCKVLLH
jgi:hypothetical protein